ncbi:transposase (fragment) [Xenorhabdus poinarii G6]|uniref:Transposase n=1 Tax=Xenorhabdus poinarii G6 TaxID=1354304 RepID=A0A068R3G4_9GAMM
MSNHRHFKTFYLGFIWQYHRNDFPILLSYIRFIGIASSVLVPFCSYLTHLKGKPTGLFVIDFTHLCVCHNIRIPRHKVFDGVANHLKDAEFMAYFGSYNLMAGAA